MNREQEINEIFTVLGFNFLYLGAFFDFFLDRHGGQHVEFMFVVPLIAAILCTVGFFQKKLLNRTILLLIGGFLSLIATPLLRFDLCRYDALMDLLFGFERPQDPAFWLLFTTGLGGMIVAAVVRLRSVERKYSHWVALASAILVLGSLMWRLNFDADGYFPVLLFPAKIFSYYGFMQRSIGVVLLIGVIAIALMAIAWGTGFKKEKINFPKIILMAAGGTFGLVLFLFFIYSCTSELQNHRYTTNLIWVFRAFMLMLTPIGFLIAKCQGFIALVELRNPEPVTAKPQPQFKLAIDNPQFMELCLHCHTVSRNRKHFHYMFWLVFAGLFVQWKVEKEVMCPSCMRLEVMKRAVYLMLSANVLWPIIIFPWTFVLMVISYLPGESFEVQGYMELQRRALVNYRSTVAAQQANPNAAPNVPPATRPPFRPHTGQNPPQNH